MEIREGETETSIRLETAYRQTLSEENIPEGVIIVTAGGLKGYSGGNFSVPVVF